MSIASCEAGSCLSRRVSLTTRSTNCSAMDSCTYCFFHAEDGIRDRNVTGVQTCALPILLQRWEEADRALAAVKTSPRGPLMRALFRIIENRPEPALESLRAIPTIRQTAVPWLAYRSEERRVGKECRSRWLAY